MRTTSLITAFILVLFSPLPVSAFGELGTLPLQWELQGIKDNLGDIKNELRNIDSSIVQERLNRMDREMNSAAIGAAQSQAMYDQNLFDLFEETAQSCPLHSTAYTKHEVIGDIAAHEQELRDFSSYMTIRNSEVKKRLSPDIVAEIERMTYTDKAAFQYLIFQKLQELRDVRNERLIKYTGICRCDTGWTGDSTRGMCVREGSSNGQVQPSPSRGTTEARPDQQLPSDVPSGAWYRVALSALVEKGDVGAYDVFRPSDLATRAEFVQLLVRSMDVPASDYAQAGLQQPGFDDVPDQYHTAFEIAATKGWVKGEKECYGSHPCKAYPDRQINRAEAAALLIRAFELRSNADAPSFSDAPAGNWFTESVQTAAGYCILQGDTGIGTVRPADTLNRAEMAVMIHRARLGLSYPHCQ